MTDTLHFVAENFEAVAHHVGPDGDTSHWIVTGPSLLPYTLQFRWMFPAAELSVWSGRWEQLMTYDARDSVPETLALAISLVYSVPGVRVR